MPGSVHVVDHPLVKHKLSLLRDKDTTNRQFRSLVHEISLLLCYECSKDLQMKDVEITTPVAIAKTQKVAETVGLVPIMRAGLGMVDAFVELLANSHVWHIGLYRDPKSQWPIEYFNKCPAENIYQHCYVLDPMLATGGTAIAALAMLKESGANRIKFIALIASPEGIKALTEAHPDVDVYVGSIDECLNDQFLIVPGCGDAGDRLFCTTEA